MKPLFGGFWGQSALFMGKWRTSGTQLRGRCTESRYAAASLRVPGYVSVSSLRDEMCLSGCLYNLSSAVFRMVVRNPMTSATAEGRLYNPSPRLACLPGVSFRMKNLPPKSGCINNLQGSCDCEGVNGFANRPFVDIYNRSSAVSLGVTCEAFARTKKAARFSNRSSPMYKLFIGASMAFQTKGQTNRNAVNIDVYSHKIRE